MHKQAHRLYWEETGIWVTDTEKKRGMGLNDQCDNLIGYDFMINIRSQTLLMWAHQHARTVSPHLLFFLGAETFLDSL